MSCEFSSLYDLTRLWLRRTAEHPTGVDRVDLSYALWAVEKATDFKGLVQTYRGFKVIEHSASLEFLKALQCKWDSAWPADQSIDVPSMSVVNNRFEEWRSAQEKFRRIPLVECIRERGLPGGAVCFMPFRSREQPVFPAGDWSHWIYMNIGHCLRFDGALRSLPDSMRRIYFLHDIIPCTYPETQKGTSRAHFKRLCEFVFHPQSSILTSSNTNKMEIENYAEAGRSIAVLPLPTEPRFTSRHGTITGDLPHYFLWVGTIEPRKNLDLLLFVWEHFSTSGDSIPLLKIVGKRGWFLHPRTQRRLDGLKRRGLIVELSEIADAQLVDLYQGARALLFPSKAEGWGLPLSEALVAGVPVIASDIPIFREVGQGIPELLPVDSVSSWTQCIRDYEPSDSPRRLAQLERMPSYQSTTWQDHFTRLEAIL